MKTSQKLTQFVRNRNFASSETKISKRSFSFFFCKKFQELIAVLVAGLFSEFVLVTGYQSYSQRQSIVFKLAGQFLDLVVRRHLPSSATNDAIACKRKKKGIVEHMKNEAK